MLFQKANPREKKTTINCTASAASITQPAMFARLMSNIGQFSKLICADTLKRCSYLSNVISAKKVVYTISVVPLTDRRSRSRCRGQWPWRPSASGKLVWPRAATLIGHRLYALWCDGGSLVQTPFCSVERVEQNLSCAITTQRRRRRPTSAFINLLLRGEIGQPSNSLHSCCCCCCLSDHFFMACYGRRPSPATPATTQMKAKFSSPCPGLLWCNGERKRKQPKNRPTFSGCLDRGHRRR